MSAENQFEDNLTNLGFEFVDGCEHAYKEIEYLENKIDVFCSNEKAHHYLFNDYEGVKIESQIADINDVKKFIKQICKIYKALYKIQKIHV